MIGAEKMSIVFEPDTKETRYLFQIYARECFIEKLLQDILTDMKICEIEGWDKTEYIRRLRDVLNGVIHFEKR